jgi:hypothetical protein
MKYVAVSQEMFERLKTMDDCAPSAAFSEDRATLLTQIVDGKVGEIREAYKAELQQLLEQSLRDLAAPREARRSLAEISFYEQSIPAYTSMFLFWIWQHRLPLSDSAVSNLVRAVFEGMLGYRLMDVHNDHQKLGAEAVVLGMHLIRTHEHRLAEVFGPGVALPVIKKYADLYVSIEYLEKSHRWKACPFSWDDARRLGGKAAPLFAILHLMLAKAGKPEREIQEFVNGLCCLAAATQMSDDFADAADDLAGGIETLVASGFYEWNECGKIEAAKVREFLDQRRIRLFIRTTLDLINTSIAHLEKVEEPVFLLLAERTKSRFLQRYRVASEAKH